MVENALASTLVNLEINFRKEEVYYSYFKIAECYNKLNKPYNETINKYLICFEYDQSRAEPLYYIGNIYENQGDYINAKKYFKRASKIPFPKKSLLFVEKYLYDYHINSMLSVTYFYLNKFDKSYCTNKKLLATNLSLGDKFHVIHNNQYNIPHVP